MELWQVSFKGTQHAVQICRAIGHYLDLILRTPATMGRRLALGDPLLDGVVGNNKVLYERGEAEWGE